MERSEALYRTPRLLDWWFALYKYNEQPNKLKQESMRYQIEKWLEENMSYADIYERLRAVYLTSAPVVKREGHDEYLRGRQ